MRRVLALLTLLVVSATGGPFDALAAPMNAFAKAYNGFAAGMGNGIFDARQAKRLSKLWRDVEHSGDWPEAGK